MCVSATVIEFGKVCALSVEWCFETLLVEVVSNETDASAENEKSVKSTNLQGRFCQH